MQKSPCTATCSSNWADYARNLVSMSTAPRLRRTGVVTFAAMLVSTGCAADGAGLLPLGNEGSSTLAQPYALPVPPGCEDLTKPAGSRAELRVLPWAGFAGAATYTFDDAQPSQVEHYAELDAVGVPLTFYITANNVTSEVDVDTWKSALASGHELGNHTVHHCHFHMKDCRGEDGGDDQLSVLPRPPRWVTPNVEIEHCTDFIMRRLGAAAVHSFAFPYGDTGYQPDAGRHFFLSRGVSPGIVTLNGDFDRLDLPVRGAKGGETALVFNGDINAVRARNAWVIFMFHSLLPSDANWSSAVDITTVTGTMRYAKDLGDVWIDTLSHVGAYWLGQRTFEAVTPEQTGAASLHWSWALPKDFPPGMILRVTVGGGELEQDGDTLAWNGHGYYEVELDRGSLDWFQQPAKSGDALERDR
jgi:hypothetical protein